MSATRLDQRRHAVQKDDGLDSLSSPENNLIGLPKDEQSLNNFHLSNVPPQTRERRKLGRLRASTTTTKPSFIDCNSTPESPLPMPPFPPALRPHEETDKSTAIKERSAGPVESRPSSNVVAISQRGIASSTSEQPGLTNFSFLSTGSFSGEKTILVEGSADLRHPAALRPGSQNILNVSNHSSLLHPHTITYDNPIPSGKYSGSSLPPPPIPPRPRSTNSVISTSKSMTSPSYQPTSPPPPLPVRPKHLMPQVQGYHDSDFRSISDRMQLMKMSPDEHSTFGNHQSGNDSIQKAGRHDMRNGYSDADMSRTHSSYEPSTILPSPRHTSLHHERLENPQSMLHSSHPPSSMYHPVRSNSEPSPNDFLVNSHPHQPTNWDGYNNYQYSQNYIATPPPSAPPNSQYYPHYGQFESPHGSPPYPYYAYSQPYYPNMTAGPVSYPNSPPSGYWPYTPPPAEHKQGMGARIGKYLGKGMASLSGQVLDDDVQNDLN